MPETRGNSIDAFLAASPCRGWAIEPMAGDASARRFFRLTGAGGDTTILMDANPENGEDLAPFLNIAAHLHKAGLSAPEIIQADIEAGLAVVEDLGHDHVTAWLARHPEDGHEIYAAATDVLIHLQQVTPPRGLATLTPAHGVAMIAPLFDHFLPQQSPRLREAVEQKLHDTLVAQAPVAATLALRDYHAENLIWRPHLKGFDRIGLIDFQDAMVTPPEYDLASLLRDARRDVGAELREAMIARFAAGIGKTVEQVGTATAILAVQRNLRILGIFTRLARRDGKTRYLSLIPRTVAMILDDLRIPALAPLAAVLVPALIDPA